MDDLQFWLYVIIGVIYLLTQIRKKAKQGAPRQAPQPRKPVTTQWKQETATPAETQKPMSFEDLLREITEAKTVSKTPQYEEPEPEYVDYDDFAEEDKTVLTETDTDYSDTKTYREFEEAKFKDYTRGTLEDTLKLENVKVEFGKFKEFAAQERVNLLELYTRDLQDPNGLKKAFVLSEVLQPRYF